MFLAKIRDFYTSNESKILTSIGIAGVIATAISSAMDTPKALKMLEEKDNYKQEHYGYSLTRCEKVLAMLPGYLPTILIGTATMGCILGLYKTNERDKAALMSAYITLHQMHEDYRRKVKEVFGKEADEKIIYELRRDEILQSEYGNIFDTITFYDEYSDRYFDMSLYEFQRAEYDMNRMYNHLGEMSLNDFYEFLDLEPITNGDKLGWNAHKDWECAGFSWIQIFFAPKEKMNGKDVTPIKFNIEPAKDYKYWNQE